MNQKVIHEALALVLPVDVETTGVDYKTAEICEVGTAYFVAGENGNASAWHQRARLFNTREPIPFEASAINNISRRMLEDQPYFDESLSEFESDFAVGNRKYFVAHNYKFDRNVLNNYIAGNPEYLKNALGEELRWLCTFRLIHHIYGELFTPDTDMANKSLNYLRYYFDLESLPSLVRYLDHANAHRAGHDALMAGGLFERMLIDFVKKMEKEELTFSSGEELLEAIFDICHSPIEYTVMPFGKHKGEKLDNVPTSYYMWAMDNVDYLNEESVLYNPDFADAIATILEGRI